MQVRCKNCFRIFESDQGQCPFCGYRDGAPAAQPYGLTPGTLLAGRYVVGQMLGQGDLDITYMAWDNQMNIQRTLKEYFPRGVATRAPGDPSVFLTSADVGQEFLNGRTRFLAQTNGGAFEANNTVYAVMEAPESAPVKDKGKAKPKGRGLKIALGVLAGALLLAAAVLGVSLLRGRSADGDRLTVALVYEARPGEAGDSLRETLEALAEDFTADREDIALDLQAVEPGDYVDTVRELSEQGPVIFESTDLTDDDIRGSMRLTDLLADLEDGTWAQRSLNIDRRWPTAIVCPVIYCNDELTSLPGDTLDIELFLDLAEEAGAVMTPAAQGLFPSYGSPASGFVNKSALDRFLAGETGLLLGTTEDLPAILEEMDGSCTLAVPAGDACYRYGQQWSAMAEEEDAEAVEALLLYMTSPEGQELLYMDTPNGQIPILRQTQEDYCRDTCPELEFLTPWLDQDFAAPGEGPTPPETPDLPDAPATPDVPETPDAPATPDTPEPPAEPEPPATPIDAVFTDVDPDAWYAEAVSFVYRRGLMGGTSESKFSPDQGMTRSQLVTVLYKLEGMPEAGVPAFKDVAPDAWYAKAVGWASSNGIVGGFDDNTFAPDRTIPREQMAMILLNFAKYKGLDTSGRADFSEIADAASVSFYAQEAMRWAYYEGLISPSSGKLSPQGDTTRAAGALVTMRLCQLLGID